MKIRTIRRQKGMLQKEVAKALGISMQQFQKYENAQNSISIFTLIKLCEFFKVPITYFLFNQQNESLEQNSVLLEFILEMK